MSSWRIHTIFFILLFAGAGIVARMFYIQVVQGGYYAALAKGQQSEYQSIKDLRRDIFIQDRFSPSGKYLAATQKKWFTLYAVPKEITDREFDVSKIAPYILAWSTSATSSPDAIKEELNIKLAKKEDSYESLAAKLTAEQTEEIRTLGIKGLYIKAEDLRHYPGGELASHTLGFVGYKGEERAGQYGVEGYYNDFLKSKNTILGGAKNLELSVDYNIQFMLENELKKAREFLAADSGSGIIMDPRTGEIIAMAQDNSFDPNNYSKVQSIDVFLNDSVQKMFEPGSSFKPFTMAAALDAGVITPVSEYVDKGYVQVWDRTFKNANEKVYGLKNMTNVLELSLNTGAVFAQQALGNDQFREYMRRFNFGGRTGIDIQGEVAGDMQNIYHTSRDVNFATASFGQGIAATPIQLITAFSAFANGGRMVKPHVIKGSEPEFIGEPITSKTAAQITAMLVSVVENGYSKKAKVHGYKVAGKTGTAQVPDKERGGYLRDKTVHSFIGFAPAYNPKFVAFIKMDGPKNINFASDSIAPIFSRVAEYILNYYEIPPDN